MSDNYLITGYHGTPHVTAENDRGINAGIFGKGKFVLPVGEQFRAEYIGSNTVRMYDGKLIDNGAAAGIPVGEYIYFLIPTAKQGRKRKDLIVFQYEKNSSTLIESGSFVVVQGTETTGTPALPTVTEADLLQGTAKKDQMALYSISVTDTSIAAPVALFKVWGSCEDISDSFFKTMDNTVDEIVGKEVCKQGNLISGSIMFTANCAEHTSFDFRIADKYAPRGYAVPNIYATDGYNYKSDIGAYMTSLGNLSIFVFDANISVILLSFSYFCA